MAAGSAVSFSGGEVLSPIHHKLQAVTPAVYATGGASFGLDSGEFGITVYSPLGRALSAKNVKAYATFEFPFGNLVADIKAVPGLPTGVVVSNWPVR